MAASDLSFSSIKRGSVRNEAEFGPFDIVGDVHGCFSELFRLLTRLGYRVEDGWVRGVAPGRRLVFLGDFWDRGPDGAAVLRLVADACLTGLALAIPGNRDIKLLRLMESGRVRRAPECAALRATMSAAQLRAIGRFLASLPGHRVLDEGRLVVAHAGLPSQRQGDDSKDTWQRAVFGGATGPPDPDGIPRRLAWARRYRGSALVVYGHTPLARPLRLGRTWGIDTGCVYGGALTALRYPELEIVSVPAEGVHAKRARPLAEPTLVGEAEQPDAEASSEPPRPA
ncbi:MAG TPA: metallophosphoesterase [Longimicrobiaceae bacterium]|nr:metallophosphoesterase [Longimicrobiaceae bacterium]